MDDERKTIEETKKYTMYSYMKTLGEYSLDENGEMKQDTLKQGEPTPLEDAVRYDSLKDAMMAFLKEEKFDEKRDRIFHINSPDDKIIYVGFSRISDDRKSGVDHLAVFFRFEAEVTTRSVLYDVTLEEIKKAFE